MQTLRTPCVAMVVAGLALISSAVGTDAKAMWIHVDGRNYSYQISPGTLPSIYAQAEDNGHTWGPMNISADGLHFDGEHVDSTETANGAAVARYNRADVQYQADPGYSFTSLSTRSRGGLTAGGFFSGAGYYVMNFAFTGATNRDTSPGNGTFRDNVTCYDRTWGYTSATTGFEELCGASQHFGIFDFNNPILMSTFDVNASQFSFSITEYVGARDTGSATASDFEFTLDPMREAPVTENSVPAPGALALLAIGLFGTGRTRTKLKAA